MRTVRFDDPGPELSVRFWKGAIGTIRDVRELLAGLVQVHDREERRLVLGNRNQHAHGPRVRDRRGVRMQKIQRLTTMKQAQDHLVCAETSDRSVGGAGARGLVAEVPERVPVIEQIELAGREGDALSAARRRGEEKGLRGRVARVDGRSVFDGGSAVHDAAIGRFDRRGRGSVLFVRTEYVGGERVLRCVRPQTGVDGRGVENGSRSSEICRRARRDEKGDQKRCHGDDELLGLHGVLRKACG